MNNGRSKKTDKRIRMSGSVANWDRWILIPVYSLMTLTLAYVVAVSLIKPQNNLIPWQMAVGTCVAIAGFLGATVLWDRLCERMPKGKWIYWILLCIYGLILYLVCWSQGDRSHTLADYSAVYQSALELAEGKELSFPRYFTIYANNVKPTLFISVILRVSFFLKLSPFHFALFLNVLRVLASIWAVGILISDEKDHGWRAWTLMLMAICVPTYVMTGAFYTDSMSFGFGVIALALLKLGAREEKLRGILCAVLAGVLTVYGAEWKMTACIPVVAGFCVLLVKKEWRKPKLLLAFAASCVLTFLVISCWSNQYEFARQSNETANPLSSWFAIGMKGDGSWNESKEFVDTINLAKTKAEKKDLTKAYVSEHLDEAFSVTHLFRKTRRNYASGMFGAQDFLSVEDDGTFTWQLMAPWGKYYWRTSQIMFCFVMLIYGMMLLGCLKALLRLLQGGEIPGWKMLADVSFLGMFLFLLIWESNNRQLYNQIPVLILGLITNARYVTSRRRQAV